MVLLAVPMALAAGIDVGGSIAAPTRAQPGTLVARVPAAAVQVTKIGDVGPTTLYSSGEPDFVLAGTDLTLPIHPLRANTTVRIVVTGVHGGAKLRIGGALLEAAGQSVTVKSDEWPVDAIWLLSLPDGLAGEDRHVYWQLETSANYYTTSAPYETAIADPLPPTTTTSSTTVSTSTTTVSTSSSTTTSTLDGPTTTVNGTVTTTSTSTSTSTSSSTTSAPPPSTTTTSIPSCMGDGCDDGDFCTDDACTPSGCVHVEPVAFDAALCRLQAVRIRIGSPNDHARSARRTVRKLQRRIVVMMNLVIHARKTPRRAATLLGRASRRLERLYPLLEQAAGAGRLAPDLATEVALLADVATNRLELLKAVLHVEQNEGGPS